MPFSKTFSWMKSFVFWFKVYWSLFSKDPIHYSDVIMGAIASQIKITGLAIVYPTVYSGADQRKHKRSASLAFLGNSPVTGEFSAQRASNAENVSIWCRHCVPQNQHWIRYRAQAIVCTTVYWCICTSENDYRIILTEEILSPLGAVYSFWYLTEDNRF